MLPKNDTSKDMKMDHGNVIKESHNIEEIKEASSEDVKENADDGNKVVKEDAGTRNQSKSNKGEKGKENKDKSSVQVNMKMEHVVF